MDGVQRWMVGNVILASCKHHFIIAHENLVQNPSYDISILIYKEQFKSFNHFQYIPTSLSLHLKTSFHTFLGLDFRNALLLRLYLVGLEIIILEIK